MRAGEPGRRDHAPGVGLARPSGRCSRRPCRRTARCPAAGSRCGGRARRRIVVQPGAVEAHRARGRGRDAGQQRGRACSCRRRTGRPRPGTRRARARSRRSRSRTAVRAARRWPSSTARAPSRAGRRTRGGGRRPGPAARAPGASCSRAVPTVLQVPTICSTGASALLTRIEAAEHRARGELAAQHEPGAQAHDADWTRAGRSGSRRMTTPPRSAAAWAAGERGEGLPAQPGGERLRACPWPATASGLRAIASASSGRLGWPRPAAADARRVTRSLATRQQRQRRRRCRREGPSAGCRTQSDHSAKGSQGASNRAVTAGPVRAAAAARGRAAGRRRRLGVGGLDRGREQRVSKRAAVRASRLLRTISKSAQGRQRQRRRQAEQDQRLDLPLPSTRS